MAAAWHVRYADEKMLLLERNALLPELPPPAATAAPARAASKSAR